MQLMEAVQDIKTLLAFVRYVLTSWKSMVLCPLMGKGNDAVHLVGIPSGIGFGPVVRAEVRVVFKGVLRRFQCIDASFDSVSEGTEAILESAHCSL